MYEGLLCVCCLSTENLEQLVPVGGENNESEDYARMLSVCLRIPLPKTEGNDFICTDCIRKLKDCLGFKQQILQSICILSSADLTQLLTEDEIQILGFTKTKESLPFEIHEIDQLQEIQETNHIQELLDSDQIQDVLVTETTGKPKTKSKRRKKPPYKAIAKEDAAPIEVTADENKEVTNKEKSRGPKGGKVKGKVGRPRKHSPSRLPYSVARDERACRECPQTFINYYSLMVHYNTHFGRHECASCHKRFMTHTSLRKHLASHDTGPFYCDVCNKEFHNVNSMLSHKRLRHGAAPFPCRECGLALRTLHARLRHLAAAHRLDTRDYRCSYCHKGFRYSSERAKHVATHHEVRVVTCAACGARVRRASLREHERRHRGLRKQRHTDPRRFRCKLCGQGFGQKKTLVYHIGSHLRRGLYAGDPAALVADTHHPDYKDKGLLSSEPDDPPEEQSVDNGPSEDARVNDLTNIHEYQLSVAGEGGAGEGVGGEGEDGKGGDLFVTEYLHLHQDDEVEDICNELGFTIIPSEDDF